tara:strand:- start:521 stop:1105 length:585 start_codon:yes stop_codon:yes gene_type:complete
MRTPCGNNINGTGLLIMLIETDYPPVRLSQAWPPVISPPPPPAQREHRFKRIPLVGWVLAGILASSRRRSHAWQELAIVEKEIVDQLEARGQIDNWVKKNNWFNTPEKQQIALIISEAIGLEKPLESPPPLHPEDPFGPLFWGPFDDLTPLTVRLEIQKKWNLHIPGDSISLAWEGDWTILQFIEYCENSINDA